MSDWYDESLHAGPDAPGYRQGFRIDKVLHRSKSGFQSIEILESRYFGEFGLGWGCADDRAGRIRYQMIAHQPMMAHGEVNDVLIIGGGDGGGFSSRFFVIRSIRRSWSRLTETLYRLLRTLAEPSPVAL